MNGPQQTACLEKGYVNNKPAKSLTASNPPPTQVLPIEEEAREQNTAATQETAAK